MIPTPLRVSTSTETKIRVGGKKALFGVREAPLQGTFSASDQRSGSAGRKKLLATVFVRQVRAFYRRRHAGSRPHPSEIDSSFTCRPSGARSGVSAAWRACHGNDRSFDRGDAQVAQDPSRLFER